MSKGTFFGDIIRNPFSLTPIQDAKAKRAKENAARDAKSATADAKQKSQAAAAEVASNQKARQAAAVNTPSKGFGSNSLDNLSRSFLLRL